MGLDGIRNSCVIKEKFRAGKLVHSAGTKMAGSREDGGRLAQCEKYLCLPILIFKKGSGRAAKQ